MPAADAMKMLADIEPPDYVIRRSRVLAVVNVTIAALFAAGGIAATIMDGRPVNLLLCTPALPFGLYGVHALVARVEVHPWGFVKRTLFARVPIAWVGIASVHHRPARPTRLVAGLLSPAAGVLGGTERLSVRTGDGKHIKFEQTTSRNDLVSRIQAGTLPRLLTLYREELNQGGTVRLGPVSVNRNTGVEIKLVRRTVIGFDELDPVRSKRGNVGFKHRDARRATWVPAEKIPNLHVLLALVDEYTHRPVEAL